MLKMFNYLNGAFYVLYGLFGAFMPKSMAGLMGWEPSLLGLHQIRAMWLLLAGLGVICLLYTAKLRDQKPIALAIVFATLSILTGRLLGLVLDGAGPMQTYQEIGLEVLLSLWAPFFIKRRYKVAKPTISAKEKLARKKDIKIVVMEKAYGGIAVGEKMFVATPQIVDNYIRNIARGDTKTIPELRDDLAHEYQCDGTCPMSTSIFIRMSAEAALEDLEAALPESEIAPFWRVITSKDKMAKKLNLPDLSWLDDKRAMEAS